MELSKKNWFNQLLHWLLFCTHRTFSYEDSWSGMPKTLCSYFWTSLLFIILSPILIPLRFVANLLGLCGTVFDRYIISTLCVIVSTTLFMGSATSTGGMLNIPVEGFWTIVGLGLFGTGVVGLALCLAVGIGALLFGLVEHIREKSYDKTFQAPKKKVVKKNVIIEYLKARKNKYCPIIKYK
jgi:hypothetical protein